MWSLEAAVVGDLRATPVRNAESTAASCSWRWLIEGSCDVDGETKIAHYRHGFTDDDPFWWIIGEPDGPRLRRPRPRRQHITVLPRSRAVIVYLSEVQVGSEIDINDLGPLHKVVVGALP